MFEEEKVEDWIFYIAPFRENSPLKRSEWNVLTTDHTVLPAAHTFIHEWNECLYFLPLKYMAIHTQHTLINSSN